VPSSLKSKSTRKKRTLKSKRGTRRLKRLLPADLADSAAIIEVREQPSSLAFAEGLDTNSGLWGRARTQWMLGDWDSLASLELGQLEQAPHRAELAALSACAQLQKGDKQSARKSLAAASRWNCAPAFMVRALVAGSEASMARYHEICGRDEKSLQLLASSAGALGGDGVLAATARKALAIPPSPGQSAASRPSPEIPSQIVDDDEPPALSLEEAIAAAKQEESPWAKPGITSYAQNFEDVMLWRALGHIENGFYIDIGAQHPITDSVSKAFYERGWRGIHVEPVKKYADLLRQDRPDEVVIEAAVSDSHGFSTLYDFPETGLSTLAPQVAEMHHGSGCQSERRTIPTVTLDDVFSFAGTRDIHWLKIDVEGHEHEVLRGWKTSMARPWIVCVEGTVPNSTTVAKGGWEPLLFAKGYNYTYFDGLNHFYTASSRPDLSTILSVPPNVFDGFSR
jgi:FkbM family methyltransferase